MALTKLTTNPETVIQSLSNKPILSAPALKAKFDEGAGLIKTYINNTLTTEIDAEIALVISDLEAEISSVVLGQIPDNTITSDKLVSSLQTLILGTQAVGDGVTDDTTTLQNEITALPTNGVLKLGAGKTYLTTSQLNLKSNITIDGNGSTIYVVSRTTGMNIFNSIDAINLTIKNINFKSVADRAQADGRRGLTSNITGIHIGTNTDTADFNNVLIENVIAENLLYVIKIDGNDGYTFGIKIDNLKAINCVQPIYVDDAQDIIMQNLDLDQATDVDKLDHHIYVNGNVKNVTIDNVICRRGTDDPTGGNAIIIASSNSLDIENVVINNVVMNEVNNLYCFSFIRVKNMMINGMNINMKSGNRLMTVQRISDVYINNFNISGTVLSFLSENNIFAGYNNRLVFSNGVFNGAVGLLESSGALFGASCTVKECVFNIDFSVLNSRFLQLGGALALETIIQNNIINITDRYSDNHVIFRITSTAADIVVDSNRINNLSGDTIDYVFWQSSNAGDVVWINNKYKDIGTLFYERGNAVTPANIKLTGIGNIIPLEFQTSIATAPSKIGLVAIVGAVVYMSTGSSTTSDWKQLTN